MFFSYEKTIELLKSVNGVALSPRELDTVACLLSGKGVKSIAFFLSLSPRTVETHIRAIMLKFGCNSREGIIEFVEKSDRFSFLKNHYLHLLHQTYLKEFLQKTSTINKHSEPVAVVIYGSIKQPNAPQHNFLHQLANYLQLAGIAAEVEEKAELPFVWANLSLWTEAVPVVGIVCQKGGDADAKPIIFLLQRSIKVEEAPQELKEIGYVHFGEPEESLVKHANNHYLAFFEVLKKILPSISLDAILTRFQNQDDSLFEKNREEIKIATTSSEELPIPNSTSSKAALFHLTRKRILISVGIICTVLIAFCFSAFHYSPFKISPHSEPIRSDLSIPHKIGLLKRTELLAHIEKAFNNQESGIQSVTLVGPGGSGKTTLSHIYSRTQTFPVVWEINAETTDSMRCSLIELAYVLAKTPEQKNEWLIIQKLTNLSEQTKQLLLFVKKSLKLASPWFLIYNNAETLSDIKDFFPDNSQVWGEGRIIITTRDINSQNTSYIDPKTVITVEDLTKDEDLTLFVQILYGYPKEQLLSAQQTEIRNFLQQIPAFPLDISIAAYYIKNTKMSFSQYLKTIQTFTEELDQNQTAFLKNVNHYLKTRYGIVKTSLEQIMSDNHEFYALLVFLFLLNDKDVPRELLDQYKTSTIVDQFLYQLKKHGLITTESIRSSITGAIFSVHPSVQNLGKHFLINSLREKNPNSLLSPIVTTLVQCSRKAREQDNILQMNLLVRHYETVLTNTDLLSHANAGRVQGELGAIYALLGNNTKAQELLESSIILLKKHDANNHEEIIQVLTYLGYIHRDLGSYQKAKDLLVTAYDMCKKHLPAEHKTLALVLVYLGKIYGSLGEYKQSIEYLEQGMNLYRGYKDQLKLAWVSSYLANIHRRLGDYQKAKNLLEEALGIYKKHFLENYSNIALASVHLGKVYSELGDYSKANQLAEQGLKIYQKYFSHNYSKIAWALTSLGNTYRHLEKYDTATSVLEQSLQIYKQHLPTNDLKINEVLIQLAKVHGDLSNWQKSQEMLEQSLKVFQTKYGMKHIETGEIYLELGRIYYLKDTLEEAELVINQALTIFQKAAHPKQYLCLEYLGDLFLKYAVSNQNKHESALKFQNQAHQYFTQSLACLEQFELKQSIHFARVQQKLRTFLITIRNCKK